MKTYVGLDVGSSEHALHLIDKNRDDPVEKATITNDLEGFKVLEGILRKHSDGGIHLGLEATGSYWKPIFDYLKNLTELEVTISLLNPNKIHQFKKMNLAGVKTDTVDARAIAKYVLTFKPDPTPRTNERLRSLRKLSRLRGSRVKERTRLISQLDDLLSEVFPEYSECFSETKAVSLLVLLDKYPGPKRIADRDPDDLADLRYGSANHRLGKAKAEKLVNLAGNTVGGDYGPETEVAIRYLANEITSIKAGIKGLEKEIAKSFREIYPNELTSIDGIAEVNGAVITTEVWDVNRFNDATKLTGYVGAYPELRESGNFKSPHPKMTKKGNPYLRSAVFTSTLSAITCNPVIEKHYQKQLAKGKDRMVALGSCMRKLVHIIYGVLTSGEKFDPNYEEKKNREKEGKNRKPQTGSYPADERSSEFSPITNNENETINCQLAGGDP
jgi:transposase